METEWMKVWYDHWSKWGRLRAHSAGAPWIMRWKAQTYKLLQFKLDLCLTVHHQCR
jgi:hypothetical protein